MLGSTGLMGVVSMAGLCVVSGAVSTTRWDSVFCIVSCNVVCGFAISKGCGIVFALSVIFSVICVLAVGCSIAAFWDSVFSTLCGISSAISTFWDSMLGASIFCVSIVSETSKDSVFCVASCNGAISCASCNFSIFVFCGIASGLKGCVLFVFP